MGRRVVSVVVGMTCAVAVLVVGIGADVCLWSLPEAGP
jgi:hypothetical protein